MTIPESTTPHEPLDTMRASTDSPHTEAGMSRLIAPDGEVNMICTTWYARLWRAQHAGWKYEEL